NGMLLLEPERHAPPCTQTIKGARAFWRGKYKSKFRDKSPTRAYSTSRSISHRLVSAAMLAVERPIKTTNTTAASSFGWFTIQCLSDRFCKLKIVLAQSCDCAYIRSQVAAYMESRRDVFQAIADPTRRAILSLVALQALTPGAIADNFKSARQTISKHIQILTECELLKPEQNGREIYYYINAKKMKVAADFIEPFRRLWDDWFNRLETIMKKYKSKK